MVNSPRESFSDYVERKGIIVNYNRKSSDTPVEINQWDIKDQLSFISEFHSRVMGYDNYIGDRLEDRRGRIVEELKIYIRKIKRQFLFTERKNKLNSFEELFLEYGEEYLEKAESSINEIFSNDYLDLLRRSMDRVEICLGDTYFTNLNKEDEIEIVKLEGCCYDMVELDAVYLLSEIKKRFNITNFNELITEYCLLEKLDNRSEGFIKGVLSYPYEFMKCCMKYNKNDGHLKEKKYKMKLEKIISRDKKYDFTERR